jgi:hypothetical protein
MMGVTQDGVHVSPPATIETIGQKLLDSLGKLADGLVNLRVTTAIGAVTASSLTDIANQTQVTFTGEAKEVASTTINMLLGDCTSVWSQGFVDQQPYAQLHKDAVADARAIRTETINMIGKGLEVVWSMRKS